MSTFAVDLVDHDGVDLPGLDIGEQLPERGAVQGAARDAAIVIGLCEDRPPFMTLAKDEGLAGLALGIQRVEVLFQPFLRRLACIGSATNDGLVMGGLTHWPDSRS